ncbi:MAG: hypothetical protein A2169_08805 [Deltaproteobacteria bacterium RBG_13_47_9]|nr:MAG: hypothetical protein A2169_08805 [Deltaproteobacteria bacterium RBG_13_47_9]
MEKTIQFILSQKLEKKRKQIDAIDHQLLILLNRRLRLALEVGNIKDKVGKKIYDSPREKKVLERLRVKNKGPMTEDQLKKIFGAIMKVCRGSQTLNI